MLSSQARRLVAESMLPQGYVWDKESIQINLYHQSVYPLSKRNITCCHNRNDHVTTETLSSVLVVTKSVSVVTVSVVTILVNFS